jgi:hypothetical protein
MTTLKRAPLTKLVASLAGFSGLLLVTACASQTETGSVDQARAALKAAEQSQAAIYAPLDYETAQQKLHAAEATDDVGKASLLSNEAIATAQLAQARSIASQQAAQLAPPATATPQMGAVPQGMTSNQIVGPAPSGQISEAPTPHIMPPLQ